MSATTLSRFLPIAGWLPQYQRGWLTPDILAGLAIWAVMVPEGMAYAGIVGVPPIMGLYTLVPPLLVYALFGTSKRLVIGPDTATGVISALTVGALAARGSAEFAVLTSTLAVLIGLCFLLFGILRSGWVAAFVATPVMRGFIEGLVLVTIIGQVTSLLGLHGASGNFIEKLLFILSHLGETSGPAALVGILSLIAMLLLKRFAPRLPAALIVAGAATIAMAVSGPVPGIALVGVLPSGLPTPRLPTLDPTILMGLLPGALSIVLVGYAEALGAAKAASSGEHIDPNEELIAHGFANASSGLFGGFLVVGSLSKTSVAMSAGAKTQLANIVAGALCLATLLFLTPLFRTLPHPALAAIVIAAMLHLSKPAYLKRLAHQAPFEFGLALIVIAGELVLGVLQGIALGGSFTPDADLSDQPSAWGGPWQVAGRGRLPRYPASSRRTDLSRAADLESRRPALLRQCGPVRDGPESGDCAQSDSGPASADRWKLDYLHRQQRAGCVRRPDRRTEEKGDIHVLRKAAGPRDCYAGA
jgi:MFS superfamily sulfate permease-like transporter